MYPLYREAMLPLLTSCGGGSGRTTTLIAEYTIKMTVMRKAPLSGQIKAKKGQEFLKVLAPRPRD